MDDTQADRAQAPLRAGVYGRLSETYDARNKRSARERTSTRRAARNCWNRSGTPRNAGKRRRRDYSDRVIDRADWLDIRQRTEDDISAARREYDRLTGSATVMSDIPPSERVRDAWESWNTDRRRAAIRAVLHRVIIKPLPPEQTPTSRATARTRPSAANAKWRSCGSASNSTGAFSSGTRKAAGRLWDRLRRSSGLWGRIPSWLVVSLGGRGTGMSRRIAASTESAAGSSIRSGNPCSTRERRASSAQASRTAPAYPRSKPVAVRGRHARCSSRRPSRRPCTRVYVQTRARAVGRDDQWDDHLRRGLLGGLRAPVPSADLDGAGPRRRTAAGAGKAWWASTR